MGIFDAAWHLLGLFVPAIGTGMIAALSAKWLWRQELRSRSWWRLSAWPSAAGSLALLGGLWILGRDGRMVSYFAMVAAAALALWWTGLRPRRG